MKKYDLALSGVLILLGVGVICLASQYGEAVAGTAIGSGVWPTILAGLLILLAVVQGVQTLIKRDRTPGPFSFKSKGMIRLYIFVGILAVFGVMLKFLGFYPAAAALTAGLLVLMNERRRWMILAVTAGVLLFVWLVFGLALGLRLPTGVF